MTNDWIMRVANGENFRNSSLYNTWGINSKFRTFRHTAKPGDRLWFVASGRSGQAIAVATFQSLAKRELGPLVSITQTNEELGWDSKGQDCDIEIHYTDLYNLENCEMFTHIKGQTSVRNVATAPCAINLPIEYSHIVRYSKVKRKM